MAKPLTVLKSVKFLSPVCNSTTAEVYGLLLLVRTGKVTYPGVVPLSVVEPLSVLNGNTFQRCLSFRPSRVIKVLGTK